MPVSIERRQFVSVLGSAMVVWPLAARAQQPERVRRIGVLMGSAEGDAESQPRVAAFLQELEKLGWKEGRNLQIEYRWAAADPDRARAYTTELIGLSPEAILAYTPMVTAAIRQQTNTIPIVFLGIGDPVRAGFVESLARPGGNVTGFSNFEYSLGGKWVELLKEIAPRVTRVMIVYDPRNVTGIGYLHTSEAAAQAVSVQLTPAPVREATEIEQAINQFAREPNGGLIVLPSPFATHHREKILTLAALNHLPAIYPFRHFVASGAFYHLGLTSSMSFGDRHPTSTEYSEERVRPSCRCRRWTNTSW